MKAGFAFGTLLLVLVGFGCDGAPAKKEAPKGDTKEVKKHDHGGWWCDEHGIPEHDCLTCKHGETGCKKRKDWCDEHEVAKSQCFKCKPDLREFYAAQYRAKYAKEPPPVDKN